MELNRQDELGNLATAFNQMGEELFRHTLTRQSFGKYVGEDVLEMILRPDREKMRLKGHKNDATIFLPISVALPPMLKTVNRRRWSTCSTPISRLPLAPSWITADT